MTRIGAFFDIDHTVLEVNSGTLWIKYQRQMGALTWLQLLQAISWLVEYRFGLLDFDAMTARILANYRGKKVAAVEEEIVAWFHRDVKPWITVEARERILEHQAQGHVVALLSSATQFLCKPVADEVGVEHILCTVVGVGDDGRFTGRYEPPASYGPGKVVLAERFAQANAVDLDQSYFYSDSYSDVPMLERVANPRVVNPDPRLQRLAKKRGWGFELWRAPVTEPPTGANDAS